MADRDPSLPDFDPRPTVRIHVGMPKQGSIVALSDSAFRLLVEAICHCGDEETNGRIPKGIVGRIATKRSAVGELIARGHMVEADAETYYLPDYLRWNRSHAEIQSFRDSKSASGSLGAHKRWHVPRRQVVPECAYCNGEAIANA